MKDTGVGRSVSGTILVCICVLLLMPFAGSEARADEAASGDESRGTFTQVEGRVRVVPADGNPGANAKDTKAGAHGNPGKNAVVGMTIESGTYIVTKSDGRARIVFPGGDQLVLGPNTTFRSSSHRNATLYELLGGVLKCWILKGGPRSNLKVHAGSDVMGVRGTEFAVTHDSEEAATSLTVFRGKVALKSAGDRDGVEVAAGQTAVVKPESTTEPAQKRSVQVKTTVIDDLFALAKETSIERVALPKTLSPEAAKNVQSLETSAAAADIHDIKLSEPKVFAAMGEAAESSDLDEVLAAAEEARENQAPSESTPVKAPPVAMPDEPDENGHASQPPPPPALVKPKEPPPPAPARPAETPMRNEFFATVGYLVSKPSTSTVFGGLGFERMAGPKFGLHVEVGNVLASQLAQSGAAGTKTDELNFFAEGALAWRPLSGKTMTTQITAGGGYANFNEFTSAGNGGFENSRGNNYSGGLLSLTLGEHVALSPRVSLLATLAERALIATSAGTVSSTILEVGVSFAP